MNEDLTAAQTCRVYAAAGMVVVWGPDQLLRHAEQLERHNRECGDVLDRARRTYRHAVRWYWGCAAMNAVVLVFLVWEKWL